MKHDQGKELTIHRAERQWVARLVVQRFQGEPWALQLVRMDLHACPAFSAAISQGIIAQGSEITERK